MCRRILIVQEHLPAFRVPFYRRLRSVLEADSIRLDLIFAPNQRNNFLKDELDWGIQVPIRWIGPLGWQNVLSHCRDRDLVVVQQELKYAVNPVLQLRSIAGGPPVAYWGHGRNFQAPDQEGPGFRLKRQLSRQVHWWFAYNDLCARIVRDLGYPAERITSVGNAIDTTSLQERRRSVTDSELSELAARLGVKSANVAVYTGGLYPLKRIGFLLEAAERIRAEIPDFELIVIGDGPDRPMVSEAADRHAWIHDVGPKNDHDKVPYWALSKVLLMPGGVGLVVLDSFALGVPMVTTDTRLHGPEIDYLRSGGNGLLIPCGESVEAYARGVVGLLRDEERLGRLREGALASAAEHTIEKMARNFAEGVMQALAAPRL